MQCYLEGPASNWGCLSLCLGGITVPKMKTHKATAKRFRRTGTGKLMRMHQGSSHLRRHKASRTLVKYRQIEINTNEAVERQVTKLAPYLD
jgi:large subunit ribosomal protein L35